MTSAIWASAIGLGASMVPKLIGLWQDKRDKEHELRLFELQLKHPQAVGESVHYDVDAERAFRELPQVLKSGDRKWDTVTSVVQSLVRPTVTMAMFLLYATFKLCISQTWSDVDTDIFAGVIFFWFGGRQVRK